MLQPSTGPSLPPLHDGQHIRLYDCMTFQDIAARNSPGTCAPRSYTVKLSTTGTVYCCTRSQLKPDTAFSDHANTQGLPVNHPTPSDLEEGQPGQRVERAIDVAITRNSLMPVMRFPEPTTMAAARHEHGYVTRSGRVVKLNIKPSL